MRYIDMRELEEREGWPPGKLEHRKQRTPEQWRAERQQAEEELRNLPPGKTRSDIFKKYSHLWSDVKKYYRELSHEKCWYCETKTGRMRGDMDHHRPKGGVTNDPSHPGYWWLAFDWRNWRFACELCNSKLTDEETDQVGGKGNDFPLGGQRIYGECDYEDLALEDPLLLDPTEPGDPELLTFTSDGRPGPASGDETALDYRRVQASITAYHLDHFKLSRERRTIYAKVLKYAVKYQKYDACFRANRSDLAAHTCAKDALANLREMIAPKAPYSAAARAYLKEYRNNNPERAWVDRILTAS